MLFFKIENQEINTFRASKTLSVVSFSLLVTQLSGELVAIVLLVQSRQPAWVVEVFQKHMVTLTKKSGKKNGKLIKWCLEFSPNQKGFHRIDEGRAFGRFSTRCSRDI